MTGLNFEIRPADAVALSVDLEFGDELDSDNARLGRGVELRFATDLRLGRALRLDVGTRYQTLSVDAGRLFRAYLTEARIEYHFGLRTFVRAIVQYRVVRRDPALYLEPVAERTNRLFSQFLFSYQLNPETVVFAGYSGTARDFAWSDAVPQERTFFLKLGYGFRL